MNRVFELIVAAVVVAATFGILALNSPGGSKTMPASQPGGYVSQYVFTSVVTAIAVFLFNRRRARPLNPWRVIMLLNAVVLLGNLCVVLYFRAHVLLSQESFSDLVADIAAGAWLAVLISWIGSFFYRRSQRRIRSEENAA